MSARDRAEIAKDEARLRLANAEFHARGVAERFGKRSPEYGIAAEIVRDARAAVVAAYDVLLAMDRGEVSP